MFLKKDVFSTVIKNTPLISIDLIIENDKGQILLGKRVNEPAFGYWFVPGGRVFKDESLDDTFQRTVKEELNLNIQRKDAIFDKTYEHFYENNVFNDRFSTHYIVLAHRIKIDTLPMVNNQHSDYKWFEVDELLQDKNVHKYTKDYFI
jgi:colanic acid biosynthesis protein WcaH